MIQQVAVIQAIRSSKAGLSSQEEKEDGPLFDNRKEYIKFNIICLILILITGISSYYLGKQKYTKAGTIIRKYESSDIRTHKSHTHVEDNMFLVVKFDKYPTERMYATANDYYTYNVGDRISYTYDSNTISPPLLVLACLCVTVFYLFFMCAFKEKYPAQTNTEL